MTCEHMDRSRTQSLIIARLQVQCIMHLHHACPVSLRTSFVLLFHLSCARPLYVLVLIFSYAIAKRKPTSNIAYSSCCLRYAATSQKFLAIVAARAHAATSYTIYKYWFSNVVVRERTQILNHSPL